MAESEKKVVYTRFKSGYLETKAGSKLKALGIHPSVPELVMVQTEDGWKTTVLREALVDNEAYQSLMAGQVPALQC